jgi:hypothetical protein
VSDADVFFSWFVGQGFAALCGVVGLLVLVSIAASYLVVLGARVIE